MAYVKVKYEENYPDRDKLVRTVSAYLRGDTKKFYIGITSGRRSGIAAMRKRRTGDGYKDLHGINRMIAIMEGHLCQKWLVHAPC